MTTAIFFLFTFLVFASHYLFFCAIFGKKTDISLSAFVSCIFQIIATEILLGSIGLLSFFYVVLLNFLVAALIVLYSIKKIDWQKFKILHCFSLKGIDNIFYLQMIIVSYGLIIFLASIIPHYTWDSITYHLHAVFSWFKNERLILAQPLSFTSYFPMNAELIMLWTYITSKNMHLLNLVQFPFAFMLALSTYSLARKLNISSAFKTIPIVLLTPVVMIHCVTEYIDVVLACFVIVSFNFIIAYLTSKKTVFFLLSFISLGLSIGTKPIALLFLPVLMMILVVFAWKQKIRIKHIILGFILLLAAGGFWYVRNFILTGNPIYPFALKILNFDLFKGFIQLGRESHFEKMFVHNKWEWFLYPVLERIQENYAYSIENGFGAQFVLGLICLIYAIFLSFFKKDIKALLVFFALPFTVFFWLKTNIDPVPRYIIFVCSIVAIAVVYVYDNMNNWQKKIMNLLIIYSLAFSFLTALPRLIPYQTEALSIFLKEKNLSPFLYYRWLYGEIAYAWERIDKDVSAGSVIACSHPELVTPLYGKNLQNNIVHIITYETPYKGNITVRDYEEWKKQLIKHNVSYFLAYIPQYMPQSIGRDLNWAQNHPEEFKRLLFSSFKGKGYVALYKTELTRESVR